jgi:hypothetical protein
MDCHKKHKTPDRSAKRQGGYSRAEVSAAAAMDLFVFLVANPPARSAPFVAQPL